MSYQRNTSRHSRTSRRSFYFDTLESRQLLAVSIQEFPLPANFSYSSITSGSNANLWLLGNQPTGFPPPFATQISFLEQYNPKTHAVSQSDLGTGLQAGPVSGPDGKVWYSIFDFVSEQEILVRFDPSTQTETRYPITINAPSSLASGPDGNLWFTTGSYTVGQFNLATQTFTEFPLPHSDIPSDITAGPDGNLWFAVTDGANQIAEINPTTHAVHEFPVGPFDDSQAPDFGIESYVDDITSGPDGNIWFTGHTTTFVAGPVPAPNSPIGYVGEINPTTHVATLINLPFGTQPTNITTGPDGNLWFTEPSTNQIGEINPRTHAVTQYAVPTAASEPDAIAAGSDGNLWFTESGAKQIGEVLLNSPTVVPPPTQPMPEPVVPIHVGPTVVDLQRYGVGQQRTKLVLTFDEPLDPVTADYVHNYHLDGPHGHPVRIIKAVYSASADTVTLEPKVRLNLRKSYKLTVVGSKPTGLADTEGYLLGGKSKSQPGSNYVASVNGSLLVHPLSRHVHHTGRRS